MFILTAIAAVDHAAKIVRHKVRRAMVPVTVYAIDPIQSRTTKAAAPLIVARRNGTTTQAALRSGELVVVTTHLATLGADDDTQRRYASNTGKAVKKAYIARTGVKPRMVWTLSREGYPIEACAYTAGDPALNEGVADYKRVAHLLAA